MQKTQPTMEQTTKKTTKILQQKNQQTQRLHRKINLQSSKKIRHNRIRKKLIHHKNPNRRRTKHDIPTIQIHTKTQKQIPTIQTPSRRRSIRRWKKHKQKMLLLRNHK